MEMTRKRAMLSLCSALFIFGTIGVVRRALPFSSALVALARAVVGAVFLILFMRVRHHRTDTAALRAHWQALLASGVMLGLNWVLLFESYRHTTVAVGTLCYYMAPIFILIASPLLLRERLSVRKSVCVAAALCGMAFVSGVFGEGGTGGSWRGVLFALAAAVFYAAVVLLNRRTRSVESFDRTVVQLGISAVVLLPYVFLTEDVTALTFDAASVGLLLLIGVLHTGVAYALYFSSISVLPAQTVGLLGYIDPVIAVLLSALLLHEPLGVSGVVGTALILGAAAAGEMADSVRKDAKSLH